MKNWSVYKHTTPSGKVYVGITSTRPEYRWNYGHGYDKQMFGAAIKKHGWDNIAHEIIASGLSKQQAIDMEVELILRCRSMEPAFGYNIMPGGECGGGVLGRKVSEETKAKMSMSGRARWQDPERKGRKQSPEWIEKRRQKNIGKTQSLEAREKTGRAVMKPVICVETGIEYESGGHACRALGGNQSQLSNHLKGTKYYKTFKGFTFVYKNNTEAEEKIRESRLEATEKTRRTVICIETGVEYESQKQVVLAFGGSSSGISGHLSGKAKSFKGHTFAFTQKN